MALARTLSVALTGVSGRLIEVEADISAGLPGLTFTGLADVSVLESRDRIRAAVLNSGLGLAEPANHRRAVAGRPAQERLDLRPRARGGGAGGGRRGAAGRGGRAGVARGTRPGRSAAPDPGRAACGAGRPAVWGSTPWWCRPPMPVRPRWSADLEGAVAAYSWPRWWQALQPGGAALPAADPVADPARIRSPDLAEVIGQPVARRALEIAAAGAHHLLLEGVPGAGKTMLAERLPSILPLAGHHRGARGDRDPLGGRRAAAGRPACSADRRCRPRITPRRWRPWSVAAAGWAGPGRPRWHIAGCSSWTRRPNSSRPCSIRCASRWSPGRIVLHRTGGAVRYPARFQLVMATNPCPCGARRDTECACTPDARRRYRRRLSGPLLDRIDLRVPIDPVSRADLMADFGQAGTSAAVADRVRLARAAAGRGGPADGWATQRRGAWRGAALGALAAGAGGPEPAGRRAGARLVERPRLRTGAETGLDHRRSGRAGRPGAGRGRPRRSACGPGGRSPVRRDRGVRPGGCRTVDRARTPAVGGRLPEPGRRTGLGAAVDVRPASTATWPRLARSEPARCRPTFPPAPRPGGGRPTRMPTWRRLSVTTSG